MNIIDSIKNTTQNIYNRYPRQYWLMIVGVMIANAGGSMIWPFLVIYASGKLNMPLRTVAALISINAGIGLISSLVAGTVADKVGRKIVMSFSLIVTGLTYFLLMRAETYPQFVILMVMLGLSNPLYQVGADAMLTDLVPSEDRADAFAINRIASNTGFAMGPAVGGFLIVRSYDLAFYCATVGFLVYSILLILFAKETLVAVPNVEKTRLRLRDLIYGYSQVIRDRKFMIFTLTISIGLIAPLMLWILMPVYSKTNYGILENAYWLIPTTNGLMCVLVQYPVTVITRRFRTLPVLITGMLIYAVGTGSVTLMQSFWGFWISMVILTFGELTFVPTSSKYITDLAPSDLRARYISVYWLGWGLARTLAPIVGGTLNDMIAPKAIWIGGLTFGFVSALGLLLLNRAAASKQSLHAEA